MREDDHLKNQSVYALSSLPHGDWSVKSAEIFIEKFFLIGMALMHSINSVRLYIISIEHHNFMQNAAQLLNEIGFQQQWHSTYFTYWTKKHDIRVELNSSSLEMKTFLSKFLVLLFERTWWRRERPFVTCRHFSFIRNLTFQSYLLLKSSEVSNLFFKCNNTVFIILPFFLSKCAS